VKVVAGWVLALLLVIGAGVGAEAVAGVGVATGAFGNVDGQIIQVGGPPGNPDVGVRGLVALTNISSGVSYHASAGRKSGYSVKVPPGAYSVTGSSLDDYSDGHPMGAYARQPVTVLAGTTVHVDLYVQIR
jgi:hypothetical protein